MNAILNIFSIKYNNSSKKKRKYLIYFAISLLTENSISTEEIIRPSQQEIVGNILRKSNLVYQQIKKNEESPGMEYLFKDAKSSNLDKTIEKLETMNSFGESFIPRV